MKIISLKRCSSTNDEAKKIRPLKENSHTIITSEIQETGRGSKGRGWVSEPGGLYLSLLICDREYGKEDIWGLTYKTALAVTDTIDFHLGEYGLESFIKWPNDVLVNEKKICGILTDMQFCGDISPLAIIGIGINVNQKRFWGDYRREPTSCFLETGREFILSDILNTLSESLTFRLAEDCSSEYEKKCSSLGRIVSAAHIGGIITGKAVGITNDGLLLIEREGEITACSSELER